ncbi:hypothetical protein [Nocardia salmonicida]|uniref:hypothetical protein n=1 Tax=Nocardia salmonicida TaxID=53431 RepID=UPI0037AA30D6
MLHLTIDNVGAPLGRVYELPFDVVATAEVSVFTQGARRVGRSHSLWYCDAERPGEFAWYETAFATDFRAEVVGPYSMHPASSQVVGALTNPGNGIDECAWPFTRLAVGDLE